MKKYFVILLLVAVVCGFSFVGKNNEKDAIKYFREYSIGQIDEMLKAISVFKEQVGIKSPKNSLQVSDLKKKFLACRNAYKKLQVFSSYFFPASEHNFNGPVVPEIEDESEQNPEIEYPHGLQVIEGCLYSEHVEACIEIVRKEIDIMQRNLNTLRISFLTIHVDESRIMEALQYQVIRTYLLTLAGFDTPECGNALEETRTEINAMKKYFVRAFEQDSNNVNIKNVIRRFKESEIYFRNKRSAEDINFLISLRDYYVPLSRALETARSKYTSENYYPPSALDFRKSSVFSTDAFNSFYFNPRGTNIKLSKDVAELGKTLFFDPLFSENVKRSCASCHKPQFAFTDNLKASSGFHENERLARNTPTILNSALQRNHFYDLRADNLEMQIGHVLKNEKEMKGNFDSLVNRLNSSPEYISYFKNVFKGSPDTVIGMNSIVNAIAEYERKLISFNTKFDRNIRAEEKTFTKEEEHGFNVFMSKGRCATCHYLPVFNNLVPPEYTRSEWEIIGTTRDSNFNNPVLDEDPGRGGLYGTEIFMHGFKTPTLRNISLTTPYMHNGAFKNLEEVIEFYNSGGGAGLGLKVPNQTLSTRKLNLSKMEKKDLRLFLNTLSDTTNLTSRPVGLPTFPEGSSYNKRVIGGEY